jgi:predicted GNAT family N-acyltransferase
MHAMDIETIDLRTISEPDARAIAKLVCAIWPKPGRTVDGLTADLLGRWKAYDGIEAQHPRSFFIREGGRMIAHASAVPRTIGTSRGDMTILALARVCTDPAARGRNLGQTVARAAFQLVDNGTFPFALFQTNEPVKPFYDRLGCVTVSNRFINSTATDPSSSAFWDSVIMRYPNKPGWPDGDIDLRGPGW